jgi:hypothetical protein
MPRAIHPEQVVLRYVLRMPDRRGGYGVRRVVPLSVGAWIKTLYLFLIGRRMTSKLFIYYHFDLWKTKN